jgi:hypothetical protein
MKKFCTFKDDKTFGTAFVVAAEVEPGGNSSETETMFEDYKNVLVLNEAGPNRGPGICKTLKLTYAMKAKLNDLLRRGKIQFHSQMRHSDFPSADIAKDELYKQMASFTRRIVNGKEVLNGKQSGNDDMLIAFMHLIQGATSFFDRKDDPKYTAFKMRWGRSQIPTEFQ